MPDRRCSSQVPKPADGRRARRRPRSSPAPAAAAATSPPDVARGKELFTQKCGACHVLAERRHEGRPGAEPRPRLQAVDRGRARAQHDRGRRREADRAAAGRPDAGRPREGHDARGRRRLRRRARSASRPRAAPPAGPSGTAKANAKNVVDDPDRPDRPARLQVQERDRQGRQGHPASRRTTPPCPHDIAIKGGRQGPVVQGGKVSEVTTNLKAGSYEFYCSRARPRAGRHEGHADRQVVGRRRGSDALARSRSTTTWVTGTSKRSRARSTTSRSSQFERPGGCVEMITSSAREHAQRVLHRLHGVVVADVARRTSKPSRAQRAEQSLEALAAPAARASSSSEVQCLIFVFSAGQTTHTSVSPPAPRWAISSRSARPTGSRSRPRGSGAGRRRCRRRGRAAPSPAARRACSTNRPITRPSARPPATASAAPVLNR